MIPAEIKNLENGLGSPITTSTSQSQLLDLEGERFFEAGRLWNFHHFQQVKYAYFATKQ